MENIENTPETVKKKLPPYFLKGEVKLFPSQVYRNEVIDRSSHINIRQLICDEWSLTLGLKPYQMNISESNAKGKRRKAYFVRKLFFYFLQEVIAECIESNAKFIAPSNAFPFSLYIKEKLPSDVDRILKGKRYWPVNIVRSEGKFYEFVIYFPTIPGTSKMRSVRIHVRDYDKITKKVNAGTRYYS